MLFNSFEFLLFLPLVFIVYWLIPSKKVLLQNLFVLAASYFFYGWWDWRFLALIAFSSLIDYAIGRQLHKTVKATQRKILLWLSVGVNIGLLATFKYFNFFSESFTDLLNTFGLNASPFTLSVILPIGISFYTFQTLSYTIDIYRKNLEPTKNLIAFLGFVSFFPQLVAGPIERAKNLLPQFLKPRTFNYNTAKLGLRQVLWGFFKKVVLADGIGEYVNVIFENYHEMSSITLVIGAALFLIQVYCDFSGYSDIAIGLAKLFGFKLNKNFAFPFFTTNVSEFWHKWHISLTRWFTDYVFIPLGGSKKGKYRTALHVLIVFFISGLWHGSGWTYIFFGVINGLYFIPNILFFNNWRNPFEESKTNSIKSLGNILGMIKVFTLVAISTLFFRSNSMLDGWIFVTKIFINTSRVDFNEILNVTNQWEDVAVLSLSLIAMFTIEWINRTKEFGIEKLSRITWIRWLIYLLLSFTIVQYFGKEVDFIYFQF